MTHLPDRDTWRKLIGPALRIVDSLRHNGYGELDFRLGGGTVLMFRFDHRISGDIDLFTNDAQALGYISPRLNDVAAYGILDCQAALHALRATERTRPALLKRLAALAKAPQAALTKGLSGDK